MHDIRAIRKDPEGFDAAMARRGVTNPAKELLSLDQERREMILSAETAQAEQNKAAKEVGAAKARGDDADFAHLRALVAEKKAEVAELQAKAKQKDAALRKYQLTLPNLPEHDIPDGDGEQENLEIRRSGTPPELGFAAKEHFALPAAQDGMDFETAAKLSGSRFVIMSGAIARLHRALAQFMLDTHITEHGLIETNTPVLVNGKCIDDSAIGQTPMGGTGQLPKFGADLYYCGSESWRQETFDALIETYVDQAELAEVSADKTKLKTLIKTAFEQAPTNEEFWLIPTSEVTLTNLVAGAVIEEDYLPRRYTAHSLCFRSEAGSAGRDTAGMLRQHQFEKVEMVSIVHPEQGRTELERMTRCAEAILEKLGLAYRTMILCTGDMGFSARRTHDIEVWLPGQNTYREISSCSYCGDFQARRMNARFKPATGGKPEFVHTLNGSGLAVGRCLIAVLENGQNEDGSVTLPAVLAPYLGGASTITAQGVLQ